jgi:uncharacterized protein YgiM (DUF1202 family)
VEVTAMGRAAVPMAIVLPAVFLCLLYPGCSGERAERKVELPSTTVLSVGSRWAVVNTNYLRMREKPLKDAEVLDGLTKGTVVEVLASTESEETIENATSYWYRISLEGLKGWVFGAYLEIVDSRSSAEDLAKKLR